MKLIIGGYASGKREFVKESFRYKASEFTNIIEESKPVLYDLQELDCSGGPEMMKQLLQKEVIICNEMGCGLVPMEAADREKREQVGRLCIELAKEAEEVYRVYAGIGTRMK